MKENVLDVLMYLFDNYWDSDEVVQTDEATLTCELEQAGFEATEIDKAFLWLEELVGLQSTDQSMAKPSDLSMRVFSLEESLRVDVDAQGLLLQLSEQKLLDPVAREIIIDRALALETDTVTLSDMKQIVGLVVLNHPTDPPQDLGWVEDMFFDAELDASAAGLSYH